MHSQTADTRVVAKHLWIASWVILAIVTAERGFAQNPVAHSVGPAALIRLPPPIPAIPQSNPRLAVESSPEPASSAIGDLQRELEMLRREVHVLRSHVQRSDALGIDRAWPEVSCAESSLAKEVYNAVYCTAAPPVPADTPMISTSI